MKQRHQALLERETQLFELLTPLGFECEHSCRYRHVPTGIKYDFSAVNLELRFILEHIIKTTSEIRYRRGKLDSLRSIREFFDTTDEEEAVVTLENYG